MIKLPKVGDVLESRFRIEREVEDDDLSLYFEATDQDFDRSVLVKLLKSGAAADREAYERAVREGRTLTKLDTPHVVHAYHAGLFGDRLPFVVLERLDGENLEERLARGRVPLEEAVGLVVQACEGLEQVHQLGFIHRDIKPKNLFLVPGADGQTLVKLVDFGITKSRGMTLTTENRALGSPAYMSPEQMRSARDVDARADIWSLGAVLYELCTGARPFDQKHLPELVVAVLNREPPVLTERNPDVPPELVRVIERCLKKERTERYASVTELRAALASFLPQTQVQAPEAPFPAPIHLPKLEPEPLPPGAFSTQPLDEPPAPPAPAVPPPAKAGAPNPQIAAALGASGPHGTLTLGGTVAVSAEQAAAGAATAATPRATPAPHDAGRANDLGPYGPVVQKPKTPAGNASTAPTRTSEERTSTEAEPRREAGRPAIGGDSLSRALWWAMAAAAVVIVLAVIWAFAT